MSTPSTLAVTILTATPEGSLTARVGAFAFDVTAGQLYYKASGSSNTGWSGITPNGIVPIGSIIAWHKSFANTPALDSRFVECNGQTLSDAASVYNGQVIPDLNNSGAALTGGLFLRGGTTSQTTALSQNDAFQGHYHNFQNKEGQNGVDANWGTAGTTHSIYTDFVLAPISDGTNGTPRTASETRPINFRVVYVMRVK